MYQNTTYWKKIGNKLHNTMVRLLRYNIGMHNYGSYLLKQCCSLNECFFTVSELPWLYYELLMQPSCRYLFHIKMQMARSMSCHEKICRIQKQSILMQTVTQNAEHNNCFYLNPTFLHIMQNTCLDTFSLKK